MNEESGTRQLGSVPIPYVEFDFIDEIRAIYLCFQRRGVHIYDIDIDRKNGKRSPRLNAILALRINGRKSHAQIVHRLFSGTSINRVKGIRGRKILEIPGPLRELSAYGLVTRMLLASPAAELLELSESTEEGRRVSGHIF